MSGTITPVDQFDATIADIVNGDDANLATFHPPIQGLTNRTHNLNQTLTVRGVPRIRTVANFAALTALSGMPNGDHAIVKGQGLYQYDSASSAPLSSPFVLAATGGGRWVHVDASSVGVASGFCGLDGSAKVPAAQLRGQLLSRAAVTAPAVTTTVSGSTPLGGAPFASQVLAAGQVWEVECELSARRTTGASADGAAVALSFAVLDGIGTVVGQMLSARADVGHFNVGSFHGYGMRGSFRAASPGTYQVQLFARQVPSGGGSVGLQTNAADCELSVWAAP